MSAGEVDHASSPHAPANAARNFPALVELLAGETLGLAHRTRDLVEERVAFEEMEVRRVQLRAAALRMRHGSRTISARADVRVQQCGCSLDGSGKAFPRRMSGVVRRASERAP